ncbi:MAG: tRNA (N6-isopentenyl adenosine(37)-C2)-methylthiotransferase MiaB [Ignavibacteria bacterium]|nr:tRNA (N6-isopentenyl adenosine(37)-C2)-methylthiotransferase MiaB [Ignavibacteria bacterium]
MFFRNNDFNELQKVENASNNIQVSGGNVYIETFGCQMNFSDTEILLRILAENNFFETSDLSKANIILLNTCSVRKHAEEKIYSRLHSFKKLKKKNPNIVIGILGCMAERMKSKLFDDFEFLDLITGPDEYRKLPDLIKNVRKGKKGVATKLSKKETYDDIIPLRKKGISAWISIMRGCDKFCSFCIVPFTRGRERSRSYNSIIKEAKCLSDEGVKEITLLGQNVNSYKYAGNDFADLLLAVADAVGKVRIRFTTSHPYDLSIKLLEAIASRENICNYIHLPVQSGSNRILRLMNRFYTIEQYKEIIKSAREIIPSVGISTDIIAGFPSETEEDHKLTLKLLEEVQFDSAFTFIYSPREGTKAYKLTDDVPAEVKKRRLGEIINLQRKISLNIHKKLIGEEKEILIESFSKKSKEYLLGRTDCNKTVIVPKGNLNIGDFAFVKINKVNSATLFGTVI